MSGPVYDLRPGGDAPVGDAPDELVVPARGNRPVTVVVVFLLLALAGWALLRPGPDPLGDGAPIPNAGIATATPAAAVDQGRRTLDQLTFLDADYAIALQVDCDTIDARGYCRRSLLDTVDGGTTWTVRGGLPTDTGGFSRLLVDPGGAIALVEDFGLSVQWRSTDRGRTWREVALTEGAPAAAPPRARLLTRAVPNCQVGCSRLLWVDVAAATTHLVPTQPQPDGDSDLWFAGPATADGLLSATDTGGTVALSVDGALSWRVTELPVDVPPGRRLGRTTVQPAGGGRVYAFVQVEGAVGLEATYGFRSEDTGATWTDIGFQDSAVWSPAGVLHGELVTTDLPGAVYLSTQRGTEFRVVPATPRSMFLSQDEPDGVVLGTVLDGRGRSTYWLSRDGRGWSPLRLPD